jgi:hypothetical protein
VKHSKPAFGLWPHSSSPADVQTRFLGSYLATSLVAWWSELLTTKYEVPGSISGSAVGSFPFREVPHSAHGLGSL